MTSLPQNHSDRVSWPTVLAFGAPAVTAGYMYLLLALYVVKFSTDVLLIAPAVMGLIFSASRILDAVTDPLVGYLSDRTTFRLGRRRTWILGGMLPIGLMYYMVFAPPESLSPTLLVVWMTVAILGVYSVLTIFVVPHMSLGAELSSDYHERSRLFGMRHAFYTAGSILALGSMMLLIQAEQDSGAAVRALARHQALIAGIAMILLSIYAVVKLRERPEFQGRLSGRPFKALADVSRNPHARVLYLVWFVENVGGAAIGVLTLYVAQYVVGAILLAPAMILSYMLPSTLSVPIWLRISRRFGKIRTWMASMVLTGVSFGGMFALPFLETLEARLWCIFVLAFFAGFAAAGGGTIGPSLQGDVVDYDELATGERKEGSYYAAWNFVYKSAYGVMLLLTGFVLQWAGYVPNEEQTMTVKLAMVSLYGLFPLCCYVAGAILFTRFKLDEQTHAQIRAELDQRQSGALETA